MREFRLKQKKLKKLMNTLFIITGVYFFVYIGVQPMIAKALGSIAAMAAAYVGYALILVSLSVLFVYTSKYSKSDKFLETIEYELQDAGCYLTSRTEKDMDSYYNAVLNDLKYNGYKVSENIEIDGFEFNARAVNGKEMFYIVCTENVDKNDIIAYLQSAIYDVTAVNIRRRGTGVVLFITDSADESALELSKEITPIDKKEKLIFANAIVETDSGKCYFLGNKPAKYQQMIANYVMNCEIPIKDDFIVKDKLSYQARLEEKMKEFNLKDFNNGSFYIR